MLVDDERDFVLTLKTVLGANGFKDSFNDPFFVLKNFNACLYDLLILDIKMIQMNGLDLNREIKKVDARVKACFLTALSDLEEYEDFKKEVFPEGERYSVVKPIDNEEMLKRANEMITVND